MLTKRRMEELIPLYVSGALSHAERKAVEAWLREHPEATSQLETWKLVQAALKGRQEKSPPEGNLQAIRLRIHATETHISKYGTPRFAPVVGVMMAVLVLITLWMSVKPGINLEWSVSGESPKEFLVYRSSGDPDDYRLIREISARQDVEQYRYTDSFLLPGKEYSYRIIGVSYDNQLVISDIGRSSTAGILPWLLAILLVSIVVGLSAIHLFQSISISNKIISFSFLQLRSF